RAMRWTVLGLGGSQVVATGAVYTAAAWFLGLPLAGATVVGGALTLSSTAIVTKLLAEQTEIHTRHGRNAVGVLLFQDLAVVPLLIVIPIFAGSPVGEQAVVWPLLLAILKGLGVFVLMVLVGRWALRPIFHEVAAARSNELFTLTVLLVALLAAWSTELAGLSLALGAFLAGIMLGETEYRHQIEADIRPFRDVLLGLFFVTVGMLLDVRVLADIWYLALLVAVAVMASKALVLYGLTRVFRGERVVAARTAILLCQCGEFGFAVISLSLADGLIETQASQLVLVAMIATMAAAPVLIRYNGAIAQRISAPEGAAAHGSTVEHAIADSASELRDHVIICGYGRTGQNLARLLEEEGFRYLALDLDPARVREARRAGEPVTFGDASREEILTAAGLDRARMVVLSFHNPTASLRVLEHTRKRRPDVPVLVRTSDDLWLERFQEAGATAVVPEVLESSLMLASHVLALLEVPMSRIFRYVRDVRSDRYRLLRGYFHGEERMDLEKADRFREQLHAITLSGNANAVGKSIAETGLDQIDVTVTAVRRGGIRGPQPEPETLLIAGDVLVLHGTPEALERAEALLLGGR
ncbi:MAG TPA: cation:proton antiporter, partial [Gammaproteobacteria bacterium]|nr:cation:proton antiporter [Gammaproteobacteria bacterium]